MGPVAIRRLTEDAAIGWDRGTRHAPRVASRGELCGARNRSPGPSRRPGAAHLVQEGILDAARIHGVSSLGAVLCRTFRRTRQQEILEKEGGELGSSREAGLAVDGHGVLAHGALALLLRCRDLLVAEALQKKQGYLALGGRQVPLPKLCVDLLTEPAQQLLRTLAPLVPLGSELVRNLDAPRERASRLHPPGP